MIGEIALTRSPSTRTVASPPPTLSRIRSSGRSGGSNRAATAAMCADQVHVHDEPMLDNPVGVGGLELHHLHHRLAAREDEGSPEDGGGGGSDSAAPMDWQERWNMALLVLLYMMQGVPLGLTTGAM